MEIALEKLAEHGVMGLFLIMVIVYFIKELKSHKDDLKNRDEHIQKLNDQLRAEAIENINLFKDTQQSLKDLVAELKIRNHG